MWRSLLLPRMWDSRLRVQLVNRANEARQTPHPPRPAECMQPNRDVFLVGFKYGETVPCWTHMLNVTSGAL
jgi:hypothetical protein